jgi:hypothetical protein
MTVVAEASHTPEVFSGGRLPDLSGTTLYAAAVLETLDDPRLTALWCCYAIWFPVDKARGERADLHEWSRRTRLAPEIVTELTTTLRERSLLTANGIPAWDLQLASWNLMQPYSDEIRRRVGIPELGPVQTTLFQELGDAEGV